MGCTGWVWWVKEGRTGRVAKISNEDNKVWDTAVFYSQ